jgi:hypothetical protein
MIGISNCFDFSKSTAYWRRRQHDFASRDGAFGRRTMAAMRFDPGQIHVAAQTLF